MIFFAHSAFDYIRSKIGEHIGSPVAKTKLLITLPIIPASVAIELCRLLEEYCTIERTDIAPCIKIARQLCDEWERSSNDHEVRAFEEASEKGWRDDIGNVTVYRNAPASSDKWITMVVLMGTDRVTDAASLADFHRCDVDAVWEECLHKSFNKWVSQRLETSHIGFEDTTLIHFDRILKPLLAYGLADLLQISTLLEKLDLSCAQDGSDAEKVLLRSLGIFGLPRFSGYKCAGAKEFGPYLGDALSFFAYDMFREERTRQKAQRTITKFHEKFKEQIDRDECFDPGEREPFNGDDEFIEGLRDYVNSGDPVLRERLRSCDFVTIRDRILKFRLPKGPKPDRVQKLTGGPIEVVLHACWLALGDFKRQALELGVPVQEVLERIRIESVLFRHDCEGDSPDERHQQAQFYIRRLIGGVDFLVRQHLNLDRGGSDSSCVLVESCLESTNMEYQYARTAEPSLEFTVTLYGVGWEEPTAKTFAWRLPKTHQYRVADDLIQWAIDLSLGIPDTWRLPVYHIPCYDELMYAKDDEETCRVLMQGIQDEGGLLSNLLHATENYEATLPVSPLQELAQAYDHFLVTANQKGLHAALCEEWIPLRQSYEKAYEVIISSEAGVQNPLAPLIMRAFLIIKQRNKAEADRWVWQPFEPSGVVTVLHPALLEMLEAHVQFLFACFNKAFMSEIRTSKARAFKDSVWQSYMDLAAVKMPLTGLIRDSNSILNTNVRGEGLIHRIGELGKTDAMLTTRLLLRYEAFEDEEITDAEIFRVTRESALLHRMMRNYQKLHPHAEDGLSIAVYQNHDIQPVIAAVDAYLSEVWEERGPYHEGYKPYAMHITIFTESSDDTGISRWIEQWRERWEAAETEGKFAHYRQTRLSISHRIISSDKYYEQFKALIKDGLEVDIVFLIDFIGAGMDGNDFKPITIPYDVTSHTLSFPILEKSLCSLSDPGRQLQRARILSNRQFRLSTLHAEVMARLKHHAILPEQQHVVVGYGDYTPWQGVVDAFHERAEWVVCIDPNIDERLIEKKGSATDTAREIIGFGSGVGSHGEANYTISTEQFRLSDILHRLLVPISEVYPYSKKEDQENIAQSILREARKLSGLSLVRATGFGEYIRDFMAYALTRKILHAEEKVFCDQLVSLDAYRHWFETADNEMRPDLLWLVAKIGKNGKLHLDLRIIECKLAKRSDDHLEKARQQIENGLRHLIPAFMPYSGVIDDERPDQRYWWLQLHRLIASKAEIASNEQKRVISALEMLADEGDFTITWGAAILAFWSDSTSAEMVAGEELSFEVEGQALPIRIFSAGSEYVRRLCCEGFIDSLDWSKRTVTFSSAYKSSEKENDLQKGIPEEKEKAVETNAVDKLIKPTLESHRGNRSQHADVHIITNTIPDRILLGTTVTGDRAIYWEFGHKDLNNRHMLIFGSSGMGKTYTIQCLLCELGRKGQNSLIVDYTNGFSENHLEPNFNALLNPIQHVVRKDPLPINPFRRLDDIIGTERITESVVNTAQRVAGVFAEVYSLGEQQKAALYMAVKNGLEHYVDDDMSLTSLIQELQDLEQSGGPEGKSASTIVSKITPFVDMNPFGHEEEGSWDRLFKDSVHRCHILQLVGFMREAWRLIVEFSLIDLYAYYRALGSKDNPRVVVLDEVQNLDQREDSPLSQLLREGRKFGFSLLLATQIMSNLQKDERDRLFLAGHKLFFRPAETEVRSYADIAAVSTGEDVNVWMKRLAQLHKGECYSLGPSRNEATGKLETKAFRIKITAMGDRGFNG